MGSRSCCRGAILPLRSISRFWIRSAGILYRFVVVVVFVIVLFSLTYLFPGDPGSELRSLRDRKPLFAFAWLLPVSGSLGQALKSRVPGQHMSPHKAVGRSKDQISCLVV